MMAHISIPRSRFRVGWRLVYYLFYLPSYVLSSLCRHFLSCILPAQHESSKCPTIYSRCCVAFRCCVFSQPGPQRSGCVSAMYLLLQTSYVIGYNTSHGCSVLGLALERTRSCLNSVVCCLCCLVFACRLIPVGYSFILPLGDLEYPRFVSIRVIALFGLVGVLSKILKSKFRLKSDYQPIKLLRLMVKPAGVPVGLSSCPSSGICLCGQAFDKPGL